MEMSSQHHSVCIILYITLISNVEALSNTPASERSISLAEGAEKPLFLTPMIEEGEISWAKKKASVELPGLDIESYSGLLTVNKEYNSNLFFWYFPAERNPRTAPVVVWLQGGPGLTSILGLFFENGPITLEKNNTLKPRKYSWTKFAHMIYIDNPVGTGYSFTEDPKGYSRNQDDVGRNLLSAIIQFFQLFPNLQQNDFYLAGDTYAGKFIPSAAFAIHINNRMLENEINLKGIAIGNGWIDPENMMTRSRFFYETGLLDYKGKLIFKKKEAEIVKLIRRQDFSTASSKLIQLIFNKPNTLFNNLTGYQVPYNLLYPYAYGVYKQQDAFEEFLQTVDIRSRIHVGNLEFHSEEEVLSNLLTDVTNSSKPYFEILIEQYKVLLYSGEFDLIIPYTTTINFLKNLEWSGADEYKKARRHFWYVAGKLAGYCKKAKNLTEVLVRRAGHLASYDQPKWISWLFKKFVTDKLL